MCNIHVWCHRTPPPPPCVSFTLPDILFVLSNQDDGRRDAQRVQNLVSQTLHYISHIYHHISDLMIDMNTQPPRQVRAPPTSIVQQAPADITISPRVIRRNNATSQTTSSTTSTTSSTTSSNVSLKLGFFMT